MFEVGKRYEIHMIMDGDETTFWSTVESYEHPLVKFARGQIVNITSPNFISAVAHEERAIPDRFKPGDPPKI